MSFEVKFPDVDLDEEDIFRIKPRKISNMRKLSVDEARKIFDQYHLNHIPDDLNSCWGHKGGTFCTNEKEEQTLFCEDCLRTPEYYDISAAAIFRGGIKILKDAIIVLREAKKL